jgi:hypothetical protein
MILFMGFDFAAVLSSSCRLTNPPPSSASSPNQVTKPVDITELSIDDF